MLFDYEAKFGKDVLKLLKSSDPISLRTSVRSPSKTEWRNVEWGVYVANYSIKSFRSMNFISDGSDVSILLTPPRPHSYWPREEHSGQTSGRRPFFPTIPSRFQIPSSRLLKRSHSAACLQDRGVV